MAREATDGGIEIGNPGTPPPNNTDNGRVDETGGGGGSTPDILGCMEPNAENYNPNATKNDGSCIFREAQEVSNVNEDVIISFRSNIKNATILRDNKVIQNVTTDNQLEYAAKELQTPRTFTVKKTGAKTNDVYQVQAIKRNLLKESIKGVGDVGQTVKNVEFLYYDVIINKLIEGSFQQVQVISPLRDGEIIQSRQKTTVVLQFTLEQDPPPPVVTGNLTFITDFPTRNFPLSYTLPNGTQERVPLSEGGPDVIKYTFTGNETLSIATLNLTDPEILREYRIKNFKITDTNGSVRNPQAFPVLITLEPNKNAVVELSFERIPKPQPTINIEFQNDIAQPNLLTYQLPPNQNFIPILDGRNNVSYQLRENGGNYIQFYQPRGVSEQYNVEFIIQEGSGKEKRFTQGNFKYDLTNSDVRIKTTLTKKELPKKCEDPKALNFGKEGECIYPPKTPKPNPPKVINISFDNDLASDNFIEYQLSDGSSGILNSGQRVIEYTLKEGVNYIRFKPLQGVDTSDYSIQYLVRNGGGRTKKITNFEFQEEFGNQDVGFEVILTKNVPPSDPPQPEPEPEPNKCQDKNALNFGEIGECKYPVPPKEILIRLIGDVVGNDLIGYRLSNGVENTIKDQRTSVKYTLQEGGPNTIQFFRSGDIDYTTHSIKYIIQNGNRTRELNEFDFTEELGNEDVTIQIFLNKDNVRPPRTQPKLSLSQTSYQYNLSSLESLVIPFSTTNTDRVRYSIGNVVRETSSSSISLSKNDFTNGVGQYTISFQPVSNIDGSGEIQKVSVNVLQTTYIPGPDITTINYPENIKGEDFVGFNVNFDVSYQSVNTNYVDIYVSKIDPNFIVRKNASPQGKITLNVGQLLNKSRQTYTQNTDKISFNLIFVPFNTQADKLAAGRKEQIRINFDQGLRIRREDFVKDIRESFQREFNTSILLKDTSKFLTHQLHLGDGNNKLIANWAIDNQTFDDSSIILKLYEPLPNDIVTEQQVWISKLQSIPVVDQIFLVDEEVKKCTPLQPNFNVDVTDPVGYEIIDTLTASGSISSTELVAQYVSSSEFTLEELDIQFVTSSDYGTDYYWKDFVKYSSAEERVENFWYKVRLLESYQAVSSSLAVGSEWTGSIEVTKERERTEQKIKKLKGGFDSFEKYLYDTTGSLSYPKTGITPVSSSTQEAESWYVTASLSAIEYDRYNVNSLVKNLPKHIQTAENGDEFILFFHMIGQHFDIIWSYIKSINKTRKLEHKLTNGIPNELIYHMLESLGWDADMGVASQTLWEYAFGENRDGTRAFDLSGKQRQYEIWRRLLNNLPYLLKHKGTKRAMHAAMACYGIPTSMLSIMEFGGPNEPQRGTTQKVTFDDRTAALNFVDTSSLIIPWKEYTSGSYSDHPNSIEARLLTTQRQDQTIFENEGNWSLKITHDTGSLARLQFEITSSGVLEVVSSSTFPFYNDEYTQFVLNRTYSGSNEFFQVWAKEGFQGRIRNDESASISLPTGSTTWESGSELIVGSDFTGSIDEFRLWRVGLNEISIENHTLIPDAIDGNSYTSSTEDLLFRLDFEYPRSLMISSSTGIPSGSVKNVSINQGYGESYATASNFPSSSQYPYNYTPYDRTVVANIPSLGLTFGEKFRFEEQTKVTELSHKARATKKSFDRAPIDSDKLGLFFSPIKEINMDILKSLGNFNIDDYIGNPSDQYSDNYRDLKTLRDYYFQRYNINLYEYIQLVRYIDKSIYQTLESLAPARAKVAKGLLIEPHFLERSKVKWERPTGSLHGINKEGRETRGDIQILIPVSSSNIMEETTLDVIEDINFNITNPNYEGTLQAETNVLISSSKNDYFGLIQADQDITLTSDKIYHVGTIETEQDITLNSEKSDYFGFLNIDEETNITSDILVNSGSTMGGIEISINAKFEGTTTEQFESDVFTQIGTDPDSQFLNGFGLYGEDGNSIRTYIDKFNNIKKERVKVFTVTEEFTIRIPENKIPFDPASGTERPQQTKTRTRVTILPFTGSDGLETTDITVGGNIIEVKPLNGYLPSHYRYVGDLTTGLLNSYHRGSKQTSLTTIDGASPVEIFTTNPNTLRVTDTGRGSGEPILEVD